MDSDTPKNPNKKRRTLEGAETDGEPQPGPSSAVLPLVAPHLVKKTSKDVNRGMYPSPKEKTRNSFTSGFYSSSPNFVKASELRKRMYESAKKRSKFVQVPSEVEASTSSSCETSEKDCTDSMVDSNTDTPPNALTRSIRFKKRRKANATHDNSNLKITRFFKHSNAISKEETAKNQNSTDNTSPNLPSTSSATPSAWAKKDPKISQILSEINSEQFFKQYRDCYGLVDNSVTDGHDYFASLPTHIIETILCQIPMLDFMSCRLVCRRWRDIIDSEKFMEWKKMYYKFKKECQFSMSESKAELGKISTTISHTCVEDSIPALLRYMGKNFNRLPSSEMYELLMKNEHGKLADQVLSERFREWNGKETRVWCQLAISILLCETVWDVLDIYKSLFTSKSACSRPDVIDALYCITTFLLYFRTTVGINSGLHYRLYYILYLIENNIPKFQRATVKMIKGLRGQQSLQGFRKDDSLTYEQIRVLNHQFDMNQKIRIIALAGTGKTTTLLHLSRLYPQIEFLNLVFNRSVNEHAKKKFPKNVTCKTAHSLAYSAVGQFMKHKLTSILRPYDLIGYLKHNEEHIQIYSYANLVLTTINNFIVSSATVMGLSHVPVDLNQKHLSFENRDRILMDAYKIWQKMVDVKDEFKITHDVYLKLYHLKRPKLDKYQCIMVDEAQDCNPVILDIVLSQNIPVIFVGDPHQQIYGFHGAQNALQSIEATHTYHLTKSFRFGPEISYIASCVLELLVNSKNKTIVGNTHDSYINGKIIGKYAVISRTNITLFNEALRMVVFKRFKANEPDTFAASFAGGFNSYGFDQISDIYKLKNLSRADRQLSDKFIKRFKTYTDLVHYARYSDDTDLLSKIEIVNQHGHDISKFIDILKDRCNAPLECANVVFSTAHKGLEAAKGLEFDTVCLTDDFPVSSGLGFRSSDAAREEANILYVALTRAKRCLLLSEKMTKLLHLAYEKFEYPVSSISVLHDKAALTCNVCKKDFVPHTVLLLMRRKVVLASQREIEAGPLCLKCGSDPYMRPDVHMNGLIMRLDPTTDNSHRFMRSIVGPLPKPLHNWTHLPLDQITASQREIEAGPLCLKCGSDPYMRPDVHMNGLIMRLDPTTDNSHRFMRSIVGPLPKPLHNWTHLPLDQITASQREIEAGPLCLKCGSDPYMRPDVHMNGLIMRLDPTTDNSHRFMRSIVGPLPKPLHNWTHLPLDQITASQREIEAGPLCLKCGSDPYMRPDVHMNGLIMYLDPTTDNSHRFMTSIVGPLPNDPPVVHDRFSEFNNADRVFVINLNLH